ncbi:histidine--tRNA ligase [Desulfohalobiaceae bacterium Ax17]|uniref:histidine--tRNA ligase n=1 Tax=Desulfovulcanus ferrireducens TaxID=2831190 RepID=UPI00207BBFB4|nr:histidine--tRNA ligase [Desulfovulcanus ferrireducens]MBT8764382.1 histidine--tRNA ligase [Desulfovulcanus ferrireducens]
MSKINKIKGFCDLFPPESNVFVFMEEKARQVFSRYGCKEIRIPILEKTELFARSIGDETDIVQKEMYTFLDRKGRSLTLRPEATAGVLRAYIENQLHSRERVSKLFTFGPMFRYERPQKGRMRQFHQINVEVLGPQAPQADAELLIMLWAYLESLGLTRLDIEINSLGCAVCRPGFHKNLVNFLQNLDQDSLCPDCQRRAKVNPLRVLDCKVARCKSLVQEAPKISEHLCSDCASHFETVLSILDQAGLSYHLNPFLVRGLDYYQRTTFEVVSSAIGAQTAVAGGGRYDGLCKALGGPDVPGLGFACGMERLALLLTDIKEQKLDFYLAVLHEQALNKALILTKRLRDAGYSGEVSFEVKSVKSQLRLANKLGVKTCLLLGVDEIERGEIVVKDMQTGVQQAVSQDDLEQALGLNLH